MKVRIKKLGKKAYGGQNSNLGLDVNPTSFGGGDYSMSKGSKGFEIKRTITADPRDQSNLEAEGGETAFGPISGDAIPDHMIIKGPRHSNGGVPLNLPDDTFIFSDTKAMRITDPVILAMFGKKKKKGGYTPAELAKPYDISKYKAILLDPNSDELSRNTAEVMIKNMIIKLGALALAQESKKGFPQGIPEMARPYMEQAGITDEDLLPDMPEEAPQGMMPPQEMPQQMAEQPMMAPPTQMPSGEPIAQATPMAPQPGMMAFGGPAELDKFVYGDGGLYKAENGDGGKKRSRRDMTPEELKAELAKQDKIAKRRGTKCGPGYVLVNGVCVKGSIGTGSADRSGEFTVPTNITRFATDVCAEIKKGRKGKAFTREEALAVGMVNERTADKYNDCYRKEEDVEGSKDFDAYELVQDQEICKCEDPTTGEEYEFPLPEGETECPCVKLIEQRKADSSITTEQRTNDPMISDIDAYQMVAAARQNPNVSPAQLVTPDRTELKVPFQEIYIQDDLAAAREASEASKTGSLADEIAKQSLIQARLMQQVGKDSAGTRQENIRNQFRGDIAKARLDSIYENAFANTLSKQNMLNKSVSDLNRMNRNQKIAGMASTFKMAEDNKRNLAWLLANPEIAEQYTADFRDPSKIYFKDPKKVTPTDEMTMAERAEAMTQINKFFPGEDNKEARKREMEMQIYGKAKFGGYLPIHVADLFK